MSHRMISLEFDETSG